MKILFKGRTTTEKTYQTAFDTTRHDIMIHLFQEVVVDRKDIRIIKSLYSGQTAEIHIGDNLVTDEFRVRKKNTQR